MNCVTGFVPGRGEAYAGFEQITTALMNALGDPDEMLRLDAVRTLAGIGASGWEGIEPPDKQIGAVLKVALEKEKDPEARRDLVVLLGKCRPSMYVEGASALAGAMKDEDESVSTVARRAMLESIAQRGVSPNAKVPIQEILPLLMKEAARDPDTTTR